MLDVTDNLVTGQIIPPKDVRRLDPDDPYLVVAADKGTATFSDIANAFPSPTASGWATPSPPAAPRLRPQGMGITAAAPGSR
ncbi:NAD-specific glutamate dehydrogenase [Chromobacterium violaceum]|uniref:NAD-specific glutamate dehydrogenase n=1 Tax=Chromobacterium violaceum TaxID=536 RepID=A0A3S4HT39_CHRVL|nr:NAD-specific glutamate dehydrogenase [Chromobacterium violaceum]